MHARLVSRQSSHARLIRVCTPIVVSPLVGDPDFFVTPGLTSALAPVPRSRFAPFAPFAPVAVAVVGGISSPIVARTEGFSAPAARVVASLSTGGPFAAPVLRPLSTGDLVQGRRVTAVPMPPRAGR